jgi:predicted amidohydrolase YtcJ
VARFQEREKRMIATGMLAGLTMIDKDLRTIPAVEIGNAKVTRTIVGGQTVYQR